MRSAPFVLAALVLASAMPAAAAPAWTVGDTVESDRWTWTVLDERGLALGGGGLDEADVADLQARGFRAVLNYRVEKPEEETPVRAAGMEYLLLEIGHAEEDTITIEELEAGNAFISSNLDAGRPVYVHCIAGFHRSAAGVVAWFMETRGWRYEEAWAHVADLRPGIEPRFADALLAYEAHLFGERKLTLDLTTERWDVDANEAVDVVAHVTENGAPVAGARVRYLDADGGEATTGADGRATLAYVAPAARGMKYVHVVAAKDGFLAGHDRNVFWVGAAKTLPALVVELGDPPPRVAPGDRVVVPIDVEEADYGSANVRVTVTTPCATLYRDYLGWDGGPEVVFRAPEAPGTYALRFHVGRFPSPEPVVLERALVVGDADGPACKSPEAAPARSPAPDGVAVAVPLRESPGAGVFVAAVAAGAVALARRRGSNDG